MICMSRFPELKKILETLGIKTVRVNRYEADDIIASYAKKCSNDERPCYIITGDKDLMQLVDDNVKVLKSDKSGYLEIDHDGVIEHYGVRPDQIVDYLSLTGDSADNIPGVKGIGPKTASGLLSDYDTIEGIYENIEKLKPAAAKKMEADKESCFMSRELVMLDFETPVDKDIEDFSTEHLKFRDARPLLEKENAKSLVKWIDANYPDPEGQGDLFSASSSSAASNAPAGGKTIQRKKAQPIITL